MDRYKGFAVFEMMLVMSTLRFAELILQRYKGAKSEACSSPLHLKAG
jgi:hypothetical protein